MLRFSIIFFLKSNRKKPHTHTETNNNPTEKKLDSECLSICSQLKSKEFICLENACYFRVCWLERFWRRIDSLLERMMEQMNIEWRLIAHYSIPYRHKSNKYFQRVLSIIHNLKCHQNLIVNTILRHCKQIMAPYLSLQEPFHCKMRLCRKVQTVKYGFSPFFRSLLFILFELIIAVYVSKKNIAIMLSPANWRIAPNKLECKNWKLVFPSVWF